MSGSFCRTGSRLLALLAVAAAALAGPQNVVAQSSVRLVPQVGLYVPMSDLGRVENGGGAVDIAKMESTLGFGLQLEIMPRSAVGLRLGGVYGTESDVPVEGVGCPGCAARSTVAALTAAAVFRPVPDLILLRPYLLAGGGLKRYDFSFDEARGEGVDAFVSDQNRTTAQLGAGVELNLGLVRLLFEVSDFISGFRLGSDSATTDGQRQHDFFITVGISGGGS